MCIYVACIDFAGNSLQIKDFSCQEHINMYSTYIYQVTLITLETHLHKTEFMLHV